MKKFLFLLCVASTAHGYEIHGTRWDQRTVPLVVSLGDDWNAAVAPAIGAWNIRALRYVPEYRQVTQAPRDGVNSVTWGTTYADGVTPLPSYVLATATHYLTVNDATGEVLTAESDIVFNANLSFGAYSGPLRRPYDIRRILVHELGHSLGLKHSDDPSAIMYPNTGNPEIPAQDDIDGQNAIYEPLACPSPTPYPTPTPSPSPTPSNIAPKNAIGNMSTRGYVGEGDNVMIAGIILTADRKVVIRALGASLAPSVKLPILLDPKLTIYDANGSQIAYNDDWALPLHSALIPKDQKESAIQLSLPAGSYTAIVSGGTGVGLVEVYDIGPRD